MIATVESSKPRCNELHGKVLVVKDYVATVIKFNDST
jgi:hypothetical protein